MVNQVDCRNPVEVLGEEFLDRRRRGEHVTPEDYASEHPELAAEIQLLFPTMVAMEQFKTCRLSSSDPPIELHIEKLTQLGDFRIIREIGRGGMGVVYEAEQQSLGRRVAVKVFPRQTLRDSRQLARFHREARTAAGLHHTNIVPVFGVGQQDGLHYYVMQRIEGVALDQAIDSGSQPVQCASAAREATEISSHASASTISGGFAAVDFDHDQTEEVCSPGRDVTPLAFNASPFPSATRSRPGRSHWIWVANVGIQVAEAVAYAHAQSVLHRDIKPSNLLLDPQGTVWITDFGLATFLEPEDRSGPDDVAGTLRFMAPEHLRGEHDPRSDIYSLGLTLYELLTLQPAFAEQNRPKLIEKIFKGELAPPRQLRPDIPRDLEAIVLKAIVLDPQRRYEDAAAMASDLRRFVAGRPVRARRVGSIGRTWRWTRRSPAVASLSAALLLVAVCSFVLISAKWREAVAENRRAEANMSLALESMDQILQRFASSWMAHPTAAEGRSGDNGISDLEFPIAVSDYSAAVLQDALKFYDRFAEQNATNPQLQRDTAKVHRRVADIYERLGQYNKAEQAYRRSLQILDSQQASGDATLEMDRASTLNQLGLTMYATSRFEEADAEFRNAIAILSKAPLSNDPKCQAELARANNNRGQSLWLMNRRDEAEQSHREAVEVLERLVQQHGQDIDYRLALARAYRIYYPFVACGKPPGDYSAIRSAGISLIEDLVGEFPNVPDYRCELSEMLTTTSFCPRGVADVDQQVEQLQRAMELSRKLSQTHSSIPRYRAVLAHTQKRLAETLSKTRRDEADKLYTKSITIYRALARDFADIPVYHTLLAMALRDHAENLHKLGRVAESRVVVQEGIEAQRAYVALRPDNHFGKRMLARLHEDLAATLTTRDATADTDKAR